jgi:hypothetical protein
MPQEHVRIRHHAERIPYPPDDYYVQEQPFYPAERRRTVAQPAPYPPQWWYTDGDEKFMMYLLLSGKWGGLFWPVGGELA